MDAIEQPSAVGLPLGLHDRDGFRHPGLRDRARLAEVVESAQHVVAPVVREREVEKGRIGNLTGALAAEQVALEQILFPAAAGLSHSVGGAGRSLELDQPVEHVDRRVERGAHRPVLSLAVPAAVGEAFAEDAFDDRGNVEPEIGAGLDRPAVDARLDLTVEVPLTGMLPTAMLGDEPDRPAGRLAQRVQPEDLQGLQGVHRRGPGLSRFAAGIRRREAGPALPQPVAALEREEARTPAFVRHSRPLGIDLVGRGIGQVAQHLPADRRVALEQPFDHVHWHNLPPPCRRSPHRPRCLAAFSWPQLPGTISFCMPRGRRPEPEFPGPPTLRPATRTSTPRPGRCNG